MHHAENPRWVVAKTDVFDQETDVIEDHGRSEICGSCRPKHTVQDSIPLPTVKGTCWRTLNSPKGELVVLHVDDLTAGFLEIARGEKC